MSWKSRASITAELCAAMAEVQKQSTKRFVEKRIESEKQMTREEAISKFSNGTGGRGNFSPEGSEGIVMGLEALGLLKFEEEKVEPKPYISYIYLDGRPFTLKEVLTALANQGYTVDKIK